jgi:hypothetical protein
VPRATRGYRLRMTTTLPDAGTPDSAASDTVAPDTPAVTDAARLLRLYLRDHEAAAGGGRTLARRLQHDGRATPFARPLRELREAIDADAVSLQRIIDRLGWTLDPVKRSLAVVAVAAGWLKPNGRLRGPSPLGLVYYLEALSAGVLAKRLLWKSLAAVADSDARLDRAELELLLRRADEQCHLLDDLHVRAVADAFVRA